MDAHFLEVLNREQVVLAQVTDAGTLSEWRGRVVAELMDAGSPYTLAMRQTRDVGERAKFLERWRRLIARAIDGMIRPDAACSWAPSSAPRPCDADSQQTAVLILAALHGGATLSQVAQDPWPLNAALDIALAPFEAPAE